MSWFYKFKRLLKRLPALCLAMTMLVMMLAGCAGEDTSSSDESSLPEGEPATAAKVGYIYNQKVSADNMTAMFEKTRRDMQSALEIETCYVDNVPVSQFEKAIAALKNDGCNIIVSCSNSFANSAYAYAKKDKDIYILSYGGSSALSNLTAMNPKLYQPAFICGAAAAWNTRSHTIGVVADNTMLSCNAVINAIIVGVQQVFKVNETDVKVAYAFTESQTNSAIDSLVAKGCDVIISYQESDYAMYYCESIGVYSIGFAQNIADAAPNGGLLGFYLNWATFMTDTVRTCINNSFTPEVYNGGINEACVKLTGYSKSVKEGTDVICETLYDYVKKGSAKIFEGELRDKDGVARVGIGTVLTHEEITKMDYLVNGVTSIESFIQPNDIPQLPELVPIYEFTI